MYAYRAWTGYRDCQPHRADADHDEWQRVVAHQRDE
jgi:hypothetical protein